MFSLILPVYNEEKTISKILTDAASFLDQRYKNYEIIVVDDGSKDLSPVIIKDIAGHNNKVIFVQHKKNRGYGAALRSGFNAASLDCIFYMDTDGQFKIEDISLIESYIHNNDMVIGYRQKRNDPFFRVFLGSLFTKIMNLFFGVHFKDINCAYKLLRRSDIQGFDLRISDNLISTEILVKAHKRGLRIRECPIPHYPRLYGRPTGVSLFSILKGFRDFLYLLWIMYKFN